MPGGRADREDEKAAACDVCATSGGGLFLDDERTRAGGCGRLGRAGRGGGALERCLRGGVSGAAHTQGKEARMRRRRAACCAAQGLGCGGSGIGPRTDSMFRGARCSTCSLRSGSRQREGGQQDSLHVARSRNDERTEITSRASHEAGSREQTRARERTASARRREEQRPGLCAAGTEG